MEPTVLRGEESVRDQVKAALSNVRSALLRAQIEVPVSLERCWALWDDREKIPRYGIPFLGRNPLL